LPPVHVKRKGRGGHDQGILFSSLSRSCLFPGPSPRHNLGTRRGDALLFSGMIKELSLSFFFFFECFHFFFSSFPVRIEMDPLCSFFSFFIFPPPSQVIGGGRNVLPEFFFLGQRRVTGARVSSSLRASKGLLFSFFLFHPFSKGGLVFMYSRSLFFPPHLIPFSRSFPDVGLVGEVQLPCSPPPLTFPSLFLGVNNTTERVILLFPSFFFFPLLQVPPPPFFFRNDVRLSNSGLSFFFFPRKRGRWILSPFLSQ